MVDDPINYSKTAEGGFRITFDSPYFFGDLVSFDSISGKGEGRLIDITLSDDGSVSYTVLLSDEEAQAGIYPEEITLLDRSG